MKQTIIFDFDGTMVDSFDVFVELFYKVSGLENRSAEEVAELRTLPPLEVARRLSLPVWHIPFLLKRGRKLIAHHLNELTLFDGIDEAIRELHNRGYKLLIMSTNTTRNIQRFLKLHGLDVYFDGVYGGTNWLLKPRTLRRLLRRRKLQADNCIYIGDETSDVEAAEANGVACIAVGWGFSAPAALRRLKPAGLATKPQALIALIHKIEAR